MQKVLFIPLNTNHVMIFHSIIKSLRSPYVLLSHDMISDSTQYQTESLLKKIEIPYKHFPKKIYRSPSDSIIAKSINCLKIKKLIKMILFNLSPSIIVLGIDSDPIAQLFISEARKLGIKTLLIQESLMRPHQYTMRKKHLSDLFNCVLRQFGIYISYIKYGTGMCDIILASGILAKKIFIQRGVPEDRIFTVGHPKYDDIIQKLKNYKAPSNKKTFYLFAASTAIIQDEKNIIFLKELFRAINIIGGHLTIKLHPRSSIKPRTIYKTIQSENESSLEVIKEGDNTFDLLKRSDTLITVSSTVVLEALMMQKECILVSYLAGESRLEYNEYDAVHTIESRDKILNVLENSIVYKKSALNKQKLLKDEMYKFDGLAGYRSARVIENILNG